DEKVEVRGIEPASDRGATGRRPAIPPVRQTEAGNAHQLVDPIVSLVEREGRRRAEDRESRVRRATPERVQDWQLHDDVANAITQAEEDSPGALDVHRVIGRMEGVCQVSGVGGQGEWSVVSG